MNLAIGFAEWRVEQESFSAPVLLRPVSVRRYGKDFELKLRGGPIVNPELVRAMADQFQIELDTEALVALAINNGVFKPQPVIDQLRGLTSHLPWFSVSPRLSVSTFADVSHALVEDASDLSHPVLDALAGNVTSRRTVQDGYHPVDATPQDQRPRPPTPCCSMRIPSRRT